jgi:hypothetical protein
MLAHLAALLLFQTTPSQEPPTRLEDVEVTGSRDAAQRFVDAVAQPAARRGLARWRTPICVGAINLDPPVAQHLVDRISSVALSLDQRVGEPGCRPNVLVFASGDGRAAAAELAPELRLGSGRTDGGSAALRWFETSDAAVRWWHTSLPIDADGQRTVRLDGDAGRDGRWGPPPGSSGGPGTRMRGRTRDDLARVVIVLDLSRTGSAPIGALADMLAFVALAQVEGGVDMAAFDTVLNLFSPEGGPAGLTDWDRTYLETLYATGSDRVDPDILAGNLAERRREAPVD